MAHSVTGRRAEREPYKLPAKWIFAAPLDKSPVSVEGFHITKLEVRGRAPSQHMSMSSAAANRDLPDLSAVYHARKVRLANADKRR